MNDLPAPKVYPLPPRARIGKSWLEIADVFAARAERERKLAWECLSRGDDCQRHIWRGEVLDEAAAYCRAQEAP